MINSKEKVLLLKLSETSKIPFNSPEELKSRASGSWRISLNKIDGIQKAIVLFHQKVIAEYKVGSQVTIHRDTHRIDLDLQSINEKKYQGLYVNVPTSNPASTMEINELDSRIVMN